jgi:uncharacterized membrane protein
MNGFRIKILELKSLHKVLVLLILSLFFLIYGLISFVNHYQFRTYALDLGMFNQALYNFAHFKANYFTLDPSGAEINYFGDHFSPITILYVPFYYVFGSYSLLVIQILAILFGGIGAYRYASLKIKNEFIRLFILGHFFSIWGIYSALSFDFHNNVIAAMLVPWLIYYDELKNKKLFFVCFFLILLAKENMALWIAFISIGLIFKNGIANKKFLFQHLFLIGFSLCYFVVIVGFVMPYIRNGEGMNQLVRYSHLGGSLHQIIKTILENPRYVFALFFESTEFDKIYFGIKSETHFMVLVSGGLLLFSRPYYLIMLIPIYAQKMLSNDYALWGINGQYSIEFVPILSLCLIDYLGNTKSTRNTWLVAIIFTGLTINYSYKAIESRSSLWYESTNSAFYRADHYDPKLDLLEIYKALDLIEGTASISCNPSICPHIAFREKIYSFPIVKDADYIVLLDNESFYPLTKESYAIEKESYKKSIDYKVIYDKNKLLILKNKNRTSSR